MSTDKLDETLQAFGLDNTVTTGGGKTGDDMSKDNEIIDVVVFPLEGDPEKRRIVSNLKNLQALVGGLIEPVRLDEKYGEGNLKKMLRAFGLEYRTPIALVNEEGLLHNMGRNRWFPQFVGSVVVMDDKDLK